MLLRILPSGTKRMLVKMLVIFSERCRWFEWAVGVGVQILGLFGGMMERCVELVYIVVQVVVSVVVSCVVLRFG